MGAHGVDRITGARWIDNYDRVNCTNTRFGGEDSGIPIVYNYRGVDNSYPFGGSAITFTNCQMSAGQGAEADSGIVNLITEVPGLISLQNCTNCVNDLVINTGQGGTPLNLDTYFDLYASPFQHFIIRIEGCVGSTVYTVPAQLYPYMITPPQGLAGFITAPPSGGSAGWHARGQRYLNNEPSELGTASSKYVITGWICTVAGEPGTWVPMRSLTGN